MSTPITIDITQELLDLHPELVEAGYQVGQVADLVGPRPRDRD